MNQPLQPPAQPAQKKPQLQAYLEDLEAVVQELRQISDEYAELKSIYRAVEATGMLPSDCELMLVVPPGRSIQLTSLGDQTAAMQALAASMNDLGQGVLGAWQKIADVVNPAIHHCQAAADRATAANQG